MNAGTAASLVDGKPSIRDLVDLEKMRVIFEKFSQATGFVINFLDHPGMTPLITTGRRGLCTEFYRTCPASAELCAKSDHRLLGRLGAPGQLAVEVCSHGLAYCGTPIIINGNHIASLTAGQVLLEKPDLERFKNHAALYGFEEDKYLEALKEVPVEPAGRLNSLTAFLGELVSVMAEQGLADAELKEKSKELENLLLSNAAAIAALRVSEEKFRDLAETLPDLIWETDESGVYSYVSPRIKEMLGYEVSEALGENPVKFFCGCDEESAKGIKTSLSGRKPFRNIECGAPHKDGRMLVLESSGNPDFDGKGRYRGYRGVTRDITERKRLEDENEMKAILLDSVKDGIFMHDLDGRIVYANEAAYAQLGYTGEEMLNVMFQKLLTPEAALKFAANTKTALEQGKAVFESEHLRGDGGKIPVETHAHAIELDEETYILRVVMDITGRKEAERAQRQLMKELENTNAEISQFNSLIAHDLQVPLRMIRSYSQLLRKRLAGKLGQEAGEFLDYVMKGGSLMQKMLDDLMHYLREGANPEILREVGMDKVLEQTLCLLKGQIEDSGAEIARGPLPAVKADSAQMTHLMQNLICNAIKFRGAYPPRISVSCAEAGREYVFTVSDNGIGIAPQFLERVFKIFQRLHTREEYPGTGVGLALCKKIVENHGGRIWAESGPGKGTAFHFSIPKDPAGFAAREKNGDAAE